MASFSMDDFVGNGILKKLLSKFSEEGWDDVPTLKIMNSEDMNAINMTRQEKKALEIRSYLHDRNLMSYGDKLEASAKNLPELLNLSNADLSSQFGMKRGHAARFMNRTSACADPIPVSLAIPARIKTTEASENNSIFKKMYVLINSKKLESVTKSPALEQSIYNIKDEDGHVFQGTVASEPAEARARGIVYPPPTVENVALYSAIKNISVQKLTPEYKIGMEHLVKSKTPPMKASELWRDKPAVFVCIRRPGCIMCRAEAHQLYTKKHIFDCLGIQLFAVFHEQIESEINDFWPHYWGGPVIFDQDMKIFKALGGGKLLKEKFFSGFLFNPRAIANYKRAKAMGMKQNFKGEGEIKGGLFIVGSGKKGIAYQFIERNFGDWAPLSEVIEICTRLQNQQSDHCEFIPASQKPE